MRGAADSNPMKKARKGRTTFRLEQSIILSKSYGVSAHPDAREKQRLAGILNLDVRTVEVWFKNRRAKWKMMPPMHTNEIPAPPASMASNNPRERRHLGLSKHGSYHVYPPGSVPMAAAHVQLSPASLSDSSLASTSSYSPTHGQCDTWNQPNSMYNLASSTPLNWTYHRPQHSSIYTQQFQSYSSNCSQPSSGHNQNDMPATQPAPQNAYGHSDYSHSLYYDRPATIQVSPSTSAFTPVTSTNTGPPVNSSAGYRGHSSYEHHYGFNHQSQNQQDWYTNQNQQNRNTDQNQFSHSSQNQNNDSH
ncbi:homeobox protein otx5-B-like [Cloeon dipterum]|uniref:homeobox protein otx5-B-like n=1 Tax=Cloeon dipterum TaxID=197152 RepID=UPI00321F8DBB